GLCASQLGVELDEDNLGYAKSEGAREPSRDELGHEHFRPLPRPAKLEDVHAIIVRFHDGGQRAALAQRRNVAGDRDCSDRRHLSEKSSRTVKLGHAGNGYAIRRFLRNPREMDMPIPDTRTLLVPVSGIRKSG